MKYNVFNIPPFDRQFKHLARKFPSLKPEYAKLVDDLENNPVIGIALPNN